METHTVSDTRPNTTEIKVLNFLPPSPLAYWTQIRLVVLDLTVVLVNNLKERSELLVAVTVSECKSKRC